MVSGLKSFILFAGVLLLFPCESYQQGRNSRNNYGSNKGEYSLRNEATHWKAVVIIVFSVMVLAAICYGTNCFFVCQMAFCENNYTKMMDHTSQV